MGVNNRQRRAAKKRREQATSRRRSPSGVRSDVGSQAAPGLLDAQRSVRAAAECALFGEVEGREEHVLFLAIDDASWQALVSEAVLREFSTRLDGLWRHGWQPVDLLRVTRRLLKPTAEPLLATVLAADARRYRSQPHSDAEWFAQLDECGATEWWSVDRPLTGQLSDRLLRSVRDLLDEAAALLAMMRRLPILPVLRPPPHAWAAARRASDRSPTRQEPVDPKIAGRLRALLSKAEATEFAEEAEALTAKAQQLMTRHSIERSMLEAGDARDDILGRRVGVDDPFAAQKAALLEVVASANRCHAVWSKDLGFSTVFGATGDLAGVEMLYVSLRLQATRAMLDAGVRQDAHGRSRTRSFRSSFLSGFATRIGTRLRQAAHQATEAATGTYGSALLPVLATHDASVTELRDRLMPGIQEVSLGTVNNAEGWRAGQVAAELADLQVGEELTARSA